MAVFSYRINIYIYCMLLILLYIIFISSSDAATVGADNDKILHMGVFPRRNMKVTREMFTPLAQYLTKQLGVEVKLDIAKNFDDFWAALHNNRYQIVHLNPYQYIRSHKELGYQAILKNEEFGKDIVSSVLIVHKNSNIHSVTDLKGKNIIFGGGPKATFSYIIPTYLLHKAGITRDMYKYSFVKNPSNAVFATYYGQSSASGAASIALKLQKVKQQIDTNKLQILIESEKFTHLPWAVSPNLTNVLRRRIQSALVALKETDEGKKVLNKAQLTGLNRTNDSEYDAHRKVTWEAIGENYCIRDCGYINSVSKNNFSKRPLVIGVFPRRTKQTTLDMFSRLARYLSYDLDRPVSIQSEKSFDEFWINVIQDKYDIVHYNQFQYVKSKKLYRYTIIAKNEEQGSDTITPAILVRNTSEIKNINDLVGKKILFYGNRSSMVSYIANTQLLRNGGVVKNSYSEKFSGNPWDACEAVSLGEADACAVATNCLLLNRLKDDRGIRKLKILTQGKPLPHLVWAVNKRIDNVLKNKIQNSLIKMDENENGRAALSDAWLTGINSAVDNEYNIHRKIILDVIGESY